MAASCQILHVFELSLKDINGFSACFWIS